MMRWVPSGWRRKMPMAGSNARDRAGRRGAVEQQAYLELRRGRYPVAANVLDFG
jgi:hypothetical protein